MYVCLFVLAKVEYRNKKKTETIKSEFKSLPVRKVSNSHKSICLAWSVKQLHCAPKKKVVVS